MFGTAEGTAWTMFDDALPSRTGVDSEAVLIEDKLEP